MNSYIVSTVSDNGKQFTGIIKFYVHNNSRDVYILIATKTIIESH